MNNYKNLLLPHPVRGKEKWALRKPGSARVVTGDKALKTTPEWCWEKGRGDYSGKLKMPPSFTS